MRDALSFLFFCTVIVHCSAQTLPPGRNQMAATFDTDKNMLLMFGGSKHYKDSDTLQLPDNKLWGFDGTTWTILSTNGPSWREDAKMVYHQREKKVYLYGGRAYSDTHQPFIYDETWTYDGSSWTQLSPAHTPGRTLHTNLVYDPIRGRIVMFGGAKTEKKDGPPFVNDIWEWDGSDWILISRENAPMPRIAHTMTFSPALKKTLIIGGVNLDGKNFSDIWSWDGNEFIKLGDNVPAVELGQHNAVSMDLSGKVGLLLFGRPVSLADVKPGTKTIYGSTWFWDGKRWSELTQRRAPLLREFHFMCFDPGKKLVLLFGGSARDESGFRTFNDMWSFDGKKWKEIRPK